jgi:hypothetical protein
MLLAFFACFSLELSSENVNGCSNVVLLAQRDQPVTTQDGTNTGTT